VVLSIFFYERQVGLIFAITKKAKIPNMPVIIILITFTALITLLIGFFEIKIPLLSIPFKSPGKKISRHTKKMLHKRMWYNQTHKGFVKLPT
jgi:hypothetical protein